MNDLRGAGGNLCPFFVSAHYATPRVFSTTPHPAPHYQLKYFHQKTHSDQDFYITKKKSLDLLLKHADALDPYISVTAEFHEAVNAGLTPALTWLKNLVGIPLSIPL